MRRFKIALSALRGGPRNRCSNFRTESNSLRPNKWLVVWVVLLATLFLGSALQAASLSTDRDDYPPGDTVVITGLDFWPGETVTVQVSHLDGFTPSTPDYDPWDVVADGSGGFVTTWVVPEDALGEILLTTAVGQESSEEASVSFPDANTQLTFVTAIPDTLCPGDGNDSVNVCATLLQKCIGGSTAPLENRPLLFFLNYGNCGVDVGQGADDTVYTDANGEACADLEIPATPGTYSIRVKFLGEDKPHDTLPGNSACPTGNDHLQLSASNICQIVEVDSAVCNEPPVAYCPGDTTIYQCDFEEICLTGFSCDDPDGNLVSCVVSMGTLDGDSVCFTPTAEGVYTITLIATDIRGEADTCQTQVTVSLEDNEPPVATCPGDITVYNDPGQCGAVVTFSATVSDNCPSATITCTPASGSFFPVGATTVTCIGSDAYGNADTCSFTVTVIDNEFPTASCPADITVNTDPGECTAVVNFSSTASDNCGVTIACTPASGSVFPKGLTTVTCIATDDSGNADTCQFTVTVVDNEDPVALCPDDITVSNDPGDCGAVVTFQANVTDNCTGATVACTPASGSVFPVGATTVTCIATDAVGNADTCSFTVTVTDDEAPVAACPSDITVNTDPGQCGAVVTFAANVTDNCPGATISCTPASGTFFPVGATAVTCVATDAVGNADTCQFTVTVIDNEFPVASCPSDITVNTDPGECSAVVDYTSTATDNCGVTIACTPSSGSVFPGGVTTVTCIATDDSGNADTCQFTVTVVDNEAPVALCPDDITVSNDPGDCGAVVTFQANVTDNCEGAMVACTPASGSVFPVGATTVTCIATDAVGNADTCSFTVTVIDDEAPVASCPSDITVDADPDACGATVTFGATVTDNCAGATIACTPPSGTYFPVGDNTVTCIATDAVGNADTCQFTVTVVDNEFPVADCPDDITVIADPGECSAVVNFTSTVTDNCDATIVCTPSSGSLFEVGVTTVTCIATDTYGNADTCQFTVTVVDNEDPVAICPEDITADNDPGECGAVVTYQSDVTDNCAGATITCDPPSGSTFPVGTTVVTCTATDAVGNTSTCDFTVTVLDTESPVAACSGDVTVDAEPGTCGATVEYTADVTDNCLGATISCSPPSGTYFSVGSPTLVRCIAVDASDNADTCQFLVTVVDNVPPVVQCPDDIVIGTDPGECSAVVTFAASVSDNCGAYVSCTPSSGSTFPIGVTTVTCIGIDYSGNADTCQFTITVFDDEDPVAVCPGDMTVDSDPDTCGAVVNFEATVTDNCPGAVVVCDPPSGSFFPVGTTLVTCTATDAADNTGTCTFNVTVNDTGAPEIVCPSTLHVQCPGDVPEPDISLVTAVDKCDPAPVVTFVEDQSDGQTCPETITRTYRATDMYDNSAECQQTILVEDTIPPVCSEIDDLTLIVCQPELICVPFECTDNCGAVATVVDGPGEIIGDEWCFTPEASGAYDVTIRCEDACQNFCEETFTVTVWMIHIQIEKVHDAPQGQFSSVALTMSGGPIDMGGFDFLLYYDASVLTPTAVDPGQLLDDCGWEYFTYRFSAEGNCGNLCPSGLLRIVALAETNNGPVHPDCYGPPDADPHVLANIQFLVSNDRTYECQYVPIGFYWIACTDNVLSTVDGSVMYLDNHIADWTGETIWDETDDVLYPEDARIPFVGAPDSCLNPDPGKPAPIRMLCFIEGGIDIVCAKDIDDRGDINLDGLAYTIADAVMFANYFVYGLSAFPTVTETSVQGAVAASDVNADGLTLSVADLVYLIRVVVGDAQPYDNPYQKVEAVRLDYRMTDGVLSVDNSVGAAWVVVDGDVSPVNLTDNMDMKHHFDGDNTRILFFSLDNEAFIGDFLHVEGRIISVEMATQDGTPVDARLIPNGFALHECYPNPFNPWTTLSFTLGTETDYRLTVFNMTGQVLQTIEGHGRAGRVELIWDASAYASGVYFYRLEAGDFSDTRKMILLK